MSVAAGREATLLAFDYGERRIGVALGNALTRSARPLTVIPNRSRDYRFDAIAALLREWQPDHLIVGLPTHPDGAPHAMTQHAKRFGNQLNGRFNLPVTWVDERYSSVDAEARLRERGEDLDQLDAEAACVILQQYLDELSDSPT
ncbi:Holliday junction resolvase RuvX [Paraburkholderia caballeronis]|uniref:Putative pre-16S rRNA nuclease n=1 Tax=Paraburkholderia caballeronis TaxID=416943 RepID=A0A1H7R3E8_9BURK|nr:Holliday junction resolvase RuvX [Paraburkholderia caballeronis]PXW23680.1 putative Holliday junction resolvase [Paraburkholderia caballeronis]PXW99021.1 putative Holliday junction resolvase [Paraburkholderia caballeronis]RAJ96227.1 putative Holliday junction resolvase [Paraburkholderia caballeronis]TDV14410.1 putative Holliday junction resolvase [Paraburkholderia caballeronis]TDV15936.1 putative Holliday junction resolvase [Paraburkholderia caballeronis]